MQRSREDEQAELQISDLKFQKRETSKATRPSPKAGEERGTLKCKGKLKDRFKNKFKDKTTCKTNQLQDELPEWYHLQRGEVNCGSYAAKSRATLYDVVGSVKGHG